MGARVFGGSNYIVTFAYSSTHKAVDLVPSGGSHNVTAHTKGEVTRIQTGIPNDILSSGNRSYGNFVTIKHSNGYYTLYAHLSSVSVKVGQSVSAGQKIGVMGNTGRSFGAHLHFELINKSGNNVNPTSYIEKNLPNMSDEEYSLSSSSSSSSTKQPKIEISDITVVSAEGNEASQRQNNLSSNTVLSEGCEILYENENGIFLPVVVDEISLEFSKRNTPGSLSFSVISEGDVNISEGNAVSFRYFGKKMFYGYVFERSETDPYKISILCYDQLRYFKNKTNVAYKGKKYSELLIQLASQNKLAVGEVEDTEHVISSRIEEGTIFDILGNAADETKGKNSKEFVIYDNFGKICLKNIDSMFVPILVDETSVASYRYTTSIDNDVYTKVTVSQDNDYTGKRELYVANNEEAQSMWGILEHTQSYNNMGQAELMEMAKTMLSSYSVKKSSLSLLECTGHSDIRGGSSLMVAIKLNDRTLNEIMIVEKVKHKFKGFRHTMDLNLSTVRGDFSI